MKDKSLKIKKVRFVYWVNFLNFYTQISVFQ